VCVSCFEQKKVPVGSRMAQDLRLGCRAPIKSTTALRSLPDPNFSHCGSKPGRAFHNSIADEWLVEPAVRHIGERNSSNSSTIFQRYAKVLTDNFGTQNHSLMEIMSCRD